MLQSAYISIISGASLWGLIALFFKFLTACGFSPLQIVALRVLFAAVLMTAVIFKIDPKLLKIRWRDSWLFIGTGIFSLVFFNYCYFRSIESSSISIAVLLLYTAPVFVMLLSIFLFREKFTRCKMLALLSTFWLYFYYWYLQQQNDIDLRSLWFRTCLWYRLCPVQYF